MTRRWLIPPTSNRVGCVLEAAIVGIGSRALRRVEEWDERETVMAPHASKPTEWDDEMDGAWEAPIIQNPSYKGLWQPRLIPNPAYQGSKPEVVKCAYI
jgi:hypothetical protein